MSLNSLVRGTALVTGLNKRLLGYRGKRRHCDNGLAWINGSEEIYNRPLRKGEGQGHYLTISISLGAVPRRQPSGTGPENVE